MKSWLRHHSTLLQVIFVSFIALIIGWALLPSNRYQCYVELKKDTIERGDSLLYFYGYFDEQKHQSDYTIPTLAYIRTPDGKKINQKELKDIIGFFPSDFPGVDSNVYGKYEIYFENSNLSCNAKKQFTVKTGKPKINPTPAEYEKNAYLDVVPEKIDKGGEVSLTYGYVDKLNNEHLSSAITTVTVETPSGKKFQAIYAKKFPSDFKGANTMESGVYIVNVERKVKTTNGSYDILFQAMNVFYAN